MVLKKKKEDRLDILISENDDDDYFQSLFEAGTGNRKSMISRQKTVWSFDRGRKVRNLWKLLELYLSDPEIQRGFNKRSKDLIEAGFTFKGIHPKIPKVVIENIMDFFEDESIQFNKKTANALRDSLVFGMGYLEIQFEDDEHTDPDEEPMTDIPIGFSLVSPLTMTIVECRDRNNKEEYGKVVGYLQRQSIYEGGFNAPLVIDEEAAKALLSDDCIFVHHKRIEPLVFDSLSDSPVGISSLEAGYNVLKSKIKADSVIGTILSRYGKPILDGEITNGQMTQIRDLFKKLQKVNNDEEDVSVLAHNDKTKINVIGFQGKSIESQSYLNYLREQVAISAGLPLSLMVGSSKGEGGDLNLVSYFQTLESDQKNILNPFIKKIIRGRLKKELGREYEGTIEISWNRIYSDEIASIKSNFMAVQNITAAVKSDPALIPLKNARKKVCELLGIEYSENDEDYTAIKESGKPQQEKPNIIPPGSDKEGGVSGSIGDGTAGGAGEKK